MIFLHQLSKIIQPTAKRIGRGKGSGKGKNAGRGEAGQRKRTRIRVGFEGGQARLMKRLPFLRGKSFRGTGTSAFAINLHDIDRAYTDGEVVSVKSLFDKGIATKKGESLKILASGSLSKKVRIASDVLISENAREKIEKAGGTVDSNVAE